MLNKILGHHSCNDDREFRFNLLCRLHSLWMVKLLGVTVVISIFFIGYFHLLNRQYFPVTLIEPTQIDKLIPFHISFLYVYISLWIYVGLSPNLMKNFKELIFYTTYAISLCVIGLICYAVYPTIFVQDLTIWQNTPQMMELKRTDNGGNAFPSLHVAFAIFSFAWIREHLKEMKSPYLLHVLNVIWCIGIVYSTMSIKQHGLFDVVSGAFLGGIVALISIVHYRKKF